MIRRPPQRYTRMVVDKNSHEFKLAFNQLQRREKRINENKIRQVLQVAANIHGMRVSLGSAKYLEFANGVYHKRTFAKGKGYSFLLYCRSHSPISCILRLGNTKLKSKNISSAISAELLKPEHMRAIEMEFAPDDY